MFLTSNLCYVDMNKTGSVYTVDNLKKNYKEYYFKHHEIPSQKIIDSDIKKIGTIRDPFSFYVSLWSYGCKQKSLSGPYNNLTKFKPFKSLGFSYNKTGASIAFFARFFQMIKTDFKENKYLYSDPTNPELFRNWLKIVLDQKKASLISAPYYFSKLPSLCGLYTFRVIKFYFYNNEKVFKGKIKTDYELENFINNNCYIDDFMNTSNLRDDLYEVLNKYEIISKPKDEVLSEGKSNSSTNSNIVFYDDETFNLVYKKEKIILNFLEERYNLNFPKKY